MPTVSLKLAHVKCFAYCPAMTMTFAQLSKKICRCRTYKVYKLHKIR